MGHLRNLHVIEGQVVKNNEPACQIKDTCGDNTNAGSDIESFDPSHMADSTPVTTKPITTPEVIKLTVKPHITPPQPLEAGIAEESAVGPDQGVVTTHAETDTKGPSLQQCHRVSYSDIAKGFGPQNKEYSKKVKIPRWQLLLN